MAIIKTVNFLPEIFRTETNEKFLNATMDQLVTEPNFTRINGYIGRKFSPTYKTNDNYVLEPSASRQNYQLEPAVVVKDKDTDTIDFFSSYLDLLQQIQYNGGLIDNHNRLFSNESYSYDGMFDYDKFTNFKNYYWVPDGPDSVDVFAGNVETQEDYEVTRNLSVSGFNFSERGIESNPVLVLARGGQYTFKIADPAHKFWIQTEPGITGTRLNQSNISTREIFGVTNNGTDDGTVTFNVPLADAQNRFTLMPTIESVDMASSVHYDEIQGLILSTFLQNNPNGIDGAKTFANLHNKSLVFITNDDVVTDVHWTNNEFFDMLRYDIVVDNQVVPFTDRRNIWRVTLVPIGDINPATGIADDYVINLVPSTAVAFDEKVYVRSGIVSGTKEYFLDFDNTYHEVPVITSILDRLYYQDSESETFYGEIRIVDAENFTIDVNKDILGQLSYASPNGVEFTNGLKIQFNNTVTPASWGNQEYYVEGVGVSIRLVKVTDLVSNETYAINGLTTPDYITINRGSQDLNGWSRSNRWFHIDVLTTTADLNKEVLIYEYTYDPNFNNEFVPVPSGVTIVSTLRSKVAIQNLTYEYTADQIFYAFGEDNFYQLGSDLVTLTKLSNYRAKNTSLPDQEFRAKRPVIEFEHSLKMFNFGIDAIDPVDYLDFTVTDAFSDIERSGSIYSATKHYLKGSVVINGTDVYGAVENNQTLPTDPLIWKPHFQLVPFDTTRTYAKGERISHNGSAWEALKNVAINVPPTANNTGIDWFELFTYITYDVSAQNTIIEGQHVDYLGFAYEAKKDIHCFPPNSDSWELLFSLTNNKSIIFANELDPEIRKRVYTISLVTIDGTPTIHLEEKTGSKLLENGDVVIVLSGKNARKNYWFDGSTWYNGQLKTKVNESPLFDAYDSNDISFGDATTYPNTTFKGTTIFQYKKGASKINDEVLGFPVSYRNFNSISDLEFETTYNSDTFTSTINLNTVATNVNKGFLIKNYSKTSKEYRNVWVKNSETSKQYQILSFQFDGLTNYFEIDIISDAVEMMPNIKVWVKNKLLSRGGFTLELIGEKLCVVIDPKYLTAEFDKVDVLLYSRKNISTLGYYEVPSNLDFNSENVDFTSLTLGQLKDHISKLEENTNVIYEASGTFTSQRDLYYKNSTGTILQHAFPLLYSNLFLTNDNANFVEGIELASREYIKFKNKFLELAGQISNVAGKTTEQHVDGIIEIINLTKDSTHPFYYSDMLPYGNNRTIHADTVINPNLKQFDLPAVFDDTELGNTATLVYVNDVQLTKGEDYYFPQDRSAVIINDTFTLVADDKIRVVVYNNTDGCYLPPTPSKLGMYPKYRPTKFLDDGYRTPINVIEGHDGSITPAFNDFRDDLLLEFEKRIYNNIKIDYDSNIFNIFEYIPGHFRDSDYSETEWKRVTARSFLKWAGFNQIDYATNRTFKSGDPWTWNFQGQLNTLNSKTLPGSARAIYLSLFDTVRPHTNPWEMLGFSTKPSWWEARYGVAPYTGGNTLLWEDLEKGYIHSGLRAGYDKNFIRTGLTSIIPVDEYGVLKSPDAFVVKSLDPSKVNRSFEVGSVSPAEFSWIKSSDYPFAVQRGLALIKPAFYFGSLLNIKRYHRNWKLKQLVNVESLKRISPNTVVVPDTYTTATATTPSTRNYVAGYLNWIVDYMKYRGLDPQAILTKWFKNIDVQLGYKTAGFTGKNYVNVLAEQSSPTSTNESIIIPDENYKIILNKSTPIRKLVYSGVIVERSGNGFTITGYDLSNPYFPIIPSVADNENHTLVVLDRRAVIYHNYQRKKILVPYGHEFNNVQQLCDFLISYGRYLVGQGFTFNEYDEPLNEQRNWELSCKEFLAWEQQEWDSGSILVLSPTFDRIDITVAGGTVDYVANETNGNKVLNQNYAVIKNTDFTVNRQPNKFSLETLNNNTICLFEGRVVQFEHAFVFDNTTVFNDIIYLPELGNRQFRLKVVGNKTADWNGELNPAGFVYNDPKISPWLPQNDYKKGSLVINKGNYYVALNDLIGSAEFDIGEWNQVDRFAIKTGLLPNFAFNAQKFVNLYNIEDMPVDERLQEFSSGIIGLRNRKYLADLNLDFQSQTKFYQGFIKEKGTKNSITALTSANFNNISSKIDMYEEWAVRVGEYGSLESDSQIEITLDDSKLTDNPSSLQLLNSADASTPDVISVKPADLYKKTTQTFTKNVFHARNDDSDYFKDISIAGFVNTADVDATLFDITNFNALNTHLKKLGDGFKIWVAKDFDLDWNVYRLTASEAQPVSINFEIDNVMSVDFSAPHNLSVKDVFCMKGFDPSYDGFYVVKSVEDLQTILVDMYQGADFLKEARTITNDTGILFEMDSMRLENPMLLNNIAPKRGWKNGDRVWVENFDSTSKWGVYEKKNTWSNSQELHSQSSDYVGSDGYGGALKINKNSDLIAIGAGNSSDGRVNIFSLLPEGEFAQTGKLTPYQHSQTLTGFGDALDVSDYVAVIGAPRTNPGGAFIHSFRVSQTDHGIQLLPAPAGASSSEGFAKNIKICDNSKWIFVGAPDANKVYCYHFEENVTNKLQTITGSTTPALVADGTTANQTYQLTFTPVDLNAIVVKISETNILTPGIDYTLSGDVLTIVPALETTVTALEVKQAGYYKLEATLTAPGGVNADAEFGKFLYCNEDGSELYVGCPSETVGTIVNCGKVYAYTRRIENQKSNPQTTSYSPTPDITSISDVFVGDMPLVKGTDYTYNSGTNEVILTTTVDAGQKIKIGSPQFDKVQELTAPTADRVTGSLFGTQIAVDSKGASVYVTAPGFKTDSYDSGKVYRYVKPNRYLGKAVSTVTNPTLTVGHNLYINGFRITLDATNIDSLNTKINSSGIPGVTSSIADGILTIASSSKIMRTKLIIACGGSTLCDDLGIGHFVHEQSIDVPGGANSETFGLSVSVGDKDDTLLIGSGNSETRQVIILDPVTGTTTSSTTFDGNSTTFIDKVFGSNAYVYELFENKDTHLTNSGIQIFAQKFDLISGSRFDFFGLALDLKNSYIIVGDPGDDKIVSNGGTAWLYKTDNTKIWSRTREEGPKVDIDSLGRMLIYSKDSNTILSNFDYIDPAKGKILGQAEVNLDFKTAVDPAFYTNNPLGTVNIEVDENLHWGSEQVGMTWWDLSKLRYIDYEQGTLAYRIKNWGKLFAGSEVSVSEWIESNVKPAEYTSLTDADGVPKYTGEGTFVTTTAVDQSTGIVKETFYYWVTKKNSAIKKDRSIVSLTEMIESPELQGIPYTALVAQNAFSLYNINNYLNGTDVVLQIRYDSIRNNNTIHTEYELIQEGNPDSNIPESIINKLIDSLAGEDASGFVVPDSGLLEQDRYGISVRPRQSMIKDRREALRNFVGTVNDVLIKHPIRQQKILTRLTSSEPDPTTAEYDFKVETEIELTYLDATALSTGYKVFVQTDSTIENRWSVYTLDANDIFQLTRVQSYDTEHYWDYVDWYAAGYDVTSKEDYTVDYEKDVKSLSLVNVGEIIRVRYNNIGTFTLYKVLTFNDVDNLELVGLGKGTIKLSDRLYDDTKYTLGFATENFDSERFDINPSIEIRNIFNGLRHDVYIGELREEFNKLFFTLIYYILYTQRNTDWIFKTSFITVLHQLRELTQYPSYVKDNQNYYIDYINEVKPYRSKIREYLISYAGNDTYWGNVTDFDLPAYYEQTIDDFRSPSGEGINDNTLLTQSEYKDWVDNKALTLESIQIAQGGDGYTVAPVVTVVDGVSGVTSAVKPIAKINASTGKVTSITFSGTFTFNSSPTIVINGNGTGAKAYPVMVNNKVRGISTTLAFDRTTYSSNLIKWMSTTDVKAGDYVYYQNEVYRADQDVAPATIFDFRYFTLLSHTHGNALDRIVAYYINSDGIPGEDLLTNLIAGINYPGVRVTGLKYADEANSETMLDSYMQSTFLDTSLGTRAEDINVDGGSFVDTYSSHAPEELVPGINFDTLIMSVFTRVTDDTGAIVSGPPLGYRVVHDLTQSQEVCPSDWAAITYNTGDYVKHSGSYYVAIADIKNQLTDTPDATPTRWRFIWKVPAAWDGTIDYDKSSYVTHGGKTYASKHKVDYKGIVATTGNLPVSASNEDFDMYYVTAETAYYYWEDSSNSWLLASADDWVAKQVYKRGDFIQHAGILYEAKRGFKYVDEVANIAALPTTDLYVYNVHFVTSEATFYWWNGSSWVATGATPNLQPEFWTGQTSISETLGSTPLSMPKIWGDVYVDPYGSSTATCPVKFMPASARKYYRISSSRSTLLTQAFALTDTTMHLTDVNAIPDPDPERAVPGVIYCQGEILYYYEKDTTNNTIGRVRRGVLGTGAPATLPIGTRVDDLGHLQSLPTGSDSSDWMNGLSEFGFVEVGDFDHVGTGFGYAYNVAYPDSPNDPDSDPGDAPFDYNISISSGGSASEQATFLSKASAYNP